MSKNKYYMPIIEFQFLIKGYIRLLRKCVHIPLFGTHCICILMCTVHIVKTKYLQHCIPEVQSWRNYDPTKYCIPNLHVAIVFLLSFNPDNEISKTYFYTISYDHISTQDPFTNTCSSIKLTRACTPPTPAQNPEACI